MATMDSRPEADAYTLMRAGRNEDALVLAGRAVAAATRCTTAHSLMAMILLNLGRLAEAGDFIDTAATLADADADACDGLAFACLRLGRYEQANTLYRRAAALAPGRAAIWYNLAASERGLGRLDHAEEACNSAIDCDPGHVQSYLLRAELRVQTRQANHVDQLRGLLDRVRPDSPARIQLGYALAKELDDLGEYDHAFRWFAEAAMIRRRHLSYDVTTDEHKIRRIIETFDDPVTAVSRRDRARFIFIVGLPRSGTTLLERMLENLPGVRSNGETDNFARALFSAPTVSDGDVFARAAAADPSAIGDIYAELAAQAPYDSIIEKLPMNYLYLGAIKRALPDAALLVVHRSPLDSCFAMFRTLFGDAYPFSYDFEDLARYHGAYSRLMDHWRGLFGEALHEIDYRDLVTAPAETGAAAAQFCGLAWHGAAIDIAANGSASFTASSAQIRRPIYRSSLDRIEHYRRHLMPLDDALNRYGTV